MNRIDKKFKELKKNKKKAFIAYVTAGDPSLAMTGRIALKLEKAGADIIELGIPFSDPLADGPTIQAASERALKKGASLKKIFKMAGSLRDKTDIPLVFMTYYNPVLKYGLDRFFADCKGKGVDGVIIPDLPCEEAMPVIRLAKKRDIATIFLAAPTSTAKRLKEIAGDSRGFIYYVSLTGVTGARKDLPAELKSKVQTIRSMTKKPVSVGFGVSNEEQAREVAKISDGVIVGSAIVKIVGKNGKGLLLSLSAFARSLAKAIHNA